MLGFGTPYRQTFFLFFYDHRYFGFYQFHKNKSKDLVPQLFEETKLRKNSEISNCPGITYDLRLVILPEIQARNLFNRARFLVWYITGKIATSV
jgi:hypothetical protein